MAQDIQNAVSALSSIAGIAVVASVTLFYWVKA